VDASRLLDAFHEIIEPLFLTGTPPSRATPYRFFIRSRIG
jgi:hypothetical protein